MTRIAVIADFLEEKWPSMDLVAEELARHLNLLDDTEASLLRPPLRTARRTPPAHGFERALGRFLQLPLELLPTRSRFDYFHIADHSYAHLALLYPHERVGIYCHDLDAFRAALPGSSAPRSRVLLSRLLLRGLRHARVVFYSTESVRAEILVHQLVPAERLVQARFGIADEFVQVSAARESGREYLLHVGSCIPRKNVELLLSVFASARARRPDLQLIQIGGHFTDSQAAYIEHHGLGPHLQQRRGLPRSELASLYASATAVLVTSSSEGFGLPVIEALACGAPVIASDLPVLREVGHEGVQFCALNDTQPWLDALELTQREDRRPTSEARSRLRAHYSWENHARIVRSAYLARSLRH